MKRFSAVGFFAALAFPAAGLAVPTLSPIEGVVRHLQVPIPGAVVCAYGVADASLARMETRRDGTFAFESLPAGIYDIVAYKSGFYPSLVRLWHQTGPAVSGLAIDLLPASPEAARATPAQDIWEWRSRIPPDVLREIDLTGVPATAGRPGGTAARLGAVAQGEVSAQSSLGGGSQSGQRADLQFAGALTSALQYRFSGRFDSLQGPPAQALATGDSKSLRLAVAGGPDSAAQLAYGATSFNAPGGGPAATLARLFAGWSGTLESGARAAVSFEQIDDTGMAQTASALPGELAAQTRVSRLRASFERSTSQFDYSLRAEAGNDRLSPADDPSLTAQRVNRAAAELSGDRSITPWLAAGGGVLVLSESGRTRVTPALLVKLRMGSAAALHYEARRAISSQDGAGQPLLLPTYLSDLAAEARISRSQRLALDVSGPGGATLALAASSSTLADAMRVDYSGEPLLDFGSIYLFAGNRVTKLSASLSARLFDLLDAAVSGETGRISGRPDPASVPALTTVERADGRFASGEVRLTLRPSRTDLACEVRRVRQTIAQATGAVPNDSEWLRLSLGQDLTLLGMDPFGTIWRLTVSVENAVSPVASDGQAVEQSSRNRFAGGLSISF